MSEPTLEQMIEPCYGQCGIADLRQQIDALKHAVDDAAQATVEAQGRKAETCQWAIDDVGGESLYETQCGHAFEFNDEGCDENGFRWCPYCGKPIVETRTSEDEADA